MSVGPGEILLVLAVALIVLGPEKLPGAARQMGRAFSEFKRFTSDAQSKVDEVVHGFDTDPKTDRNRDEKQKTQVTADETPEDGGAEDGRGDKIPEESRPKIQDTTGFELIENFKPKPRPPEDDTEPKSPS